ncbi:GIY-YIG nuclease family protein [Alcaligenes faecalis]|uniref:GIY-YIG nuclease family protein n=1 Tax=Alcaligenes faecalis TaxID=511 RepID=UPI0015E7E901|nr:GIY-YIG nuclease family protein [Alcaligenes faecalis]
MDRAQKKEQTLNWGGAAEPVTIHLYVLSLTDEHFYAGLTHDVGKRLKQHFSGTGAEWSKLHPPRRLAHTICTAITNARKAEQMEDEATVAMMLDYGIDKVHGRHFCSLEQELIEVELRS